MIYPKGIQLKLNVSAELILSSKYPEYKFSIIWCIHLFLHSFSKGWLNTNSVPGIVLGTGDAMKAKTMFPALLELFPWDYDI